MRVAVIGQGSIGRRHAGILLELGHDVTVYDPDPAVQTPPGATAKTSTRQCLEAADAAIVASPSSEHPSDTRTAIESGVAVLVEKPLALDAARATELNCLAQERGVMLSVAMSLREHAGVRAVARLLAEKAIGRALRASAWCGSWLPGWHPDEDYRRGYSARAELGGGVLLDVAVHELDYLLWLLGPVVSVSALARQVSGLETNVEDVALIFMELASGGLLEVVVDYFDRSYTRGCRIVGSHGTLHWSWEDQRVTLHNVSGSPLQLDVPSDSAPAYRRQLERFLAAVRDGSPPPVSAGEACQVLAALDAARTSSRDGRRVTIAPVVTLRAATASDSELVRAWRNDPETRRWSRTSHEIGAAEHAAWFERNLADRSTQLWIAQADSRSIGQVRIAAEAAGTAEVHFALAPEARGRELGTAVLIQAAARALTGRGVRLLCAHVKPEHTASLRAFTRAGFNEVGTDEHGLVRVERAPTGL